MALSLCRGIGPKIILSLPPPSRSLSRFCSGDPAVNLRRGMISRRCIRGDKGSRGDVSTLPTLVVDPMLHKKTAECNMVLDESKTCDRRRQKETLVAEGRFGTQILKGYLGKEESRGWKRGGNQWDFISNNLRITEEIFSQWLQDLAGTDGQASCGFNTLSALKYSSVLGLSLLLVLMARSQRIGKVGNIKSGEGAHKRLKIAVQHFLGLVSRFYIEVISCLDFTMAVFEMSMQWLLLTIDRSTGLEYEDNGASVQWLPLIHFAEIGSFRFLYWTESGS
ncbi:hypothetical protein DY000_02015336 [Brassica cretica]|uniref:Uncharacterized protein n=1 Tax=Brassica cretica TaxID=69181 RepID=A0ABQ7CU94_BRACR|nr:hypothetical protein DY000_02015336 [Brassica cretica]